MKKVFEELNYYALGKKGHLHKVKHGKLKENKNVTRIQNFLGKYAKFD